MKRKTFLLMLLFPFAAGFCQSLVTSDKLWNNVIRDYWNYYHVYTETLQFTDDTLIGTNTYKRVERSVDSLQLVWTNYGFIREDAGFPDAITLYPNPAGDQVTVTAPAGAFQRYAITTMAGQPLLQGVLPASMTVNTETLPPGIYLVRLEGEQTGKRETVKLVKE